MRPADRLGFPRIELVVVGFEGASEVKFVVDLLDCFDSDAHSGFEICSNGCSK